MSPRPFILHRTSALSDAAFALFFKGSDVAHAGKIWPNYNPARRCLMETAGCIYPPTEMQFQVDNWSGLVGIGSPTGARGMYADPYDPSFFGWSYSIQLQGAILRNWTLRLVFLAEPAGLPGYAIDQWAYGAYFQCIDVGGNQVQCQELFFEPNSQFYEPQWYFGTPEPQAPFYAPVSGSTIYPTNLISFRGRRWTDLPPKPPMSAPF
jgi:hypothetical protein